ncbi:PLP-dependent cysteine synthase family protein [Allorhizobium undicola]|uniref:PLP-dependent cysteine synthase family protein n=1 Tax=Allorhizobium undicola TaxID=78527 RepID=UPI000A046F6B|nr:pyridoxal-phosphate dependent enzyme [Allorhizobium undicola]
MPRATPMISPRANLRVKLEHMNPAGSHKARAARHILRKAIAEGELKPGGIRRILEKSGGNFGIGLAFEAMKLGIGVDLVIGLSFSPVKRRLCEEFGARLVGVDLLHEGKQPKQVIATLLEEQGSRYFFTDQFANDANFQAHIEETGPEIIAQLDRDADRFDGVTLVVGAGTGAHAAALESVFRPHFKKFELVVIEPENCSFLEGTFGSHGQQGAAVGVRPPFLDLAKVDAFAPITDQQAGEGQRMMARHCGIYPGPTGGANYLVAHDLAIRHPERLVLTMTYDTGEGYLSQTMTG